MPVYETYFRRKRQSKQTAPDVYRYDRIPTSLRNQIHFIWDDTIGPYYVPHGYGTSSPPNNNEAWKFIRGSVCRELGVRSLGSGSDAKSDCVRFLQGEQDVDKLLTLVEFSFRYIDRYVRKLDSYDRKELGITQSPDDAIKELNFRFREAGVGYQFEGGQIIRMDSEVMHSEVVLPAIHFLSDPRFSGAQDEFLSAHAHYRAGEYKDCVTDANNALESTMKTICDIEGWKYQKGARASDLVKVLRDNGLFPDYLDNSFDQLIATLKSGLPKVRDEEGAHGQGAEPKATPPYLAGYALHLAGAKIVLLAKALEA